MGYVKFKKWNNTLYHTCNSLENDRGICEFSTSDDGDTNFKCRACGESFDLGDLTQDVALYYYDRVETL